MTTKPKSRRRKTTGPRTKTIEASRQRKLLREQEAEERHRLDRWQSSTVLSLLAYYGSMSLQSVARRLKTTRYHADRLLSSMVSIGSIEACGNRSSTLYQLPQANGEVLEPEFPSADNILASFRTKSEQRFASRAGIVGHKRKPSDLQAA